MGIGPAANGWNELAITLSTNPFAVPVDVYLAVQGPQLGDALHMLTPGYALRPRAEVGLVPWKTQVSS